MRLLGHLFVLCCLFSTTLFAVGECPTKWQRLALIHSIETNLQYRSGAGNEVQLAAFKQALRTLNANEQITLQLLEDLRAAFSEKRWDAKDLATMPEYKLVRALSVLEAHGKPAHWVPPSPEELAERARLLAAAAASVAEAAEKPPTPPTRRQQLYVLFNSIDALLAEDIAKGAVPDPEVRETIVAFRSKLQQLLERNEISLELMQQLHAELREKAWRASKLLSLPSYATVQARAEKEGITAAIPSSVFAQLVPASQNLFAGPRTIMGASSDGQYFLEGATAGVTLHTFGRLPFVKLAQSHMHPTEAVFFRQGDRQLVASLFKYGDGFAVWDTASGARLGSVYRSLGGTDQPTTSHGFVVRADGKLAMVGGDTSGKIVLWDLNSFSRVGEIDARLPNVSALALSEDESLLLATAGDRHSVYLTEISDTVTPLGGISIEAEPIAAAGFAHGRHEIVLVSGLGKVAVFNLNREKVRRFETGTNNAVLSSDGRWVVGFENDAAGSTVLKMWSTENGKLISKQTVDGRGLSLVAGANSNHFVLSTEVKDPTGRVFTVVNQFKFELP